MMKTQKRAMKMMIKGPVAADVAVVVEVVVGNRQMKRWKVWKSLMPRQMARKHLTHQRNLNDQDRRRVRKRTPDVAIDGGEMLDAIAAAPFLSPPATEEDGSDEEIDVDAAANDETAAPDKDEPRKRRRGRRSRRKSAETEEAMADNQTPEAVSEKIESAETPDPEAIDASDT